MSCICKSPIRPEFKDSYKDLLDKPRINGTIINGDIETDDLGIKYPKLIDKPSINGVPLEGALTAEDLGIKAGAKFKIVTALPTTDIDPLTIYLVPADVSGESNFYQEFIYINGSWEKVGEPITMEGGGGGVFAIPPNLKRVLFDGASYTIDFDFLTNTFPSANFKRGCTYICFGDHPLTIAAPTSGFITVNYWDLETVRIKTINIDASANPDGYSFRGTIYITNGATTFGGVIQNVFLRGSFNP